MFDAFAVVILQADVASAGLRAGDLGAIVGVHGDGAAYTVEFFDPDGETIAVPTLTPDNIRLATPQEIVARRALHERGE